MHTPRLFVVQRYEPLFCFCTGLVSVIVSVIVSRSVSVDFVVYVRRPSRGRWSVVIALAWQSPVASAVTPASNQIVCNELQT